MTKSIKFYFIILKSRIYIAELNPDVLYNTTMDPEKRTLVKLTIDDLELTDTECEIQLAENAADKRKVSMKNYHIDIDDLDR